MFASVSDRNNSNHGIYDQRNSLLSKQHKDKLTTNILNSHGSLRTRGNMSVTSIAKDVRKPINGHTYSYREHMYQQIQVPKLESDPVSQSSTVDNVHQSVPARQQSTRNAPTSKSIKHAPIPNNASQSESVSQSSARGSVRQSDPARQASTEYSGITDDDIKLNSSNEDIMSNIDGASLADKQNHPLEQLNNAFNGFHSDDEPPIIEETFRPVAKSGDDDCDEIPKLVVDILPYGQFEELKITLKSSEYEPLSNYLHFRNQSMNSRSGIITEKRLSNKRRNSVSFRLPVDHVDKPYSPMKIRTWSKAKTLPMQATQPVHNNPPQTISIAGNYGNSWHTGNKIYVKDRRSVKLPFYGIYGFSDINNRSVHTTYLEPCNSHAVLNSRKNSSIFRHKSIR